MGQVLHGSATTTEAVRRAIQHSQESLRALAKRYGVNPKTIAKWKRRASAADLPTGPKKPQSTVLTYPCGEHRGGVDWASAAGFVSPIIGHQFFEAVDPESGEGPSGGVVDVADPKAPVFRLHVVGDCVQPFFIFPQHLGDAGDGEQVAWRCHVRRPGALPRRLAAISRVAIHQAG